MLSAAVAVGYELFNRLFLPFCLLLMFSSGIFPHNTITVGIPPQLYVFSLTHSFINLFFFTLFIPQWRHLSLYNAMILVHLILFYPLNYSHKKQLTRLNFG